MKKQIYILTIPIIFAFCSEQVENNSLVIDKSVSINKLELLMDSGFVTKKVGLPFLLSNNLTDTTESSWEIVNDNDTIAKYYKVKESGHYYYCSIDLSRQYSFETHLIIELSSEGEIIKSERFLHGNYSCCWNNYYDGFNKYGDYYGIDICGTGSGYCTTYLFLFKNLIPQNSQKEIPINYWSSSGEGESYSLSSSMNLNKEIIIMHYRLDEGELDDSLNFKINKSREFDVEFNLIKGIWTTNDTAKFECLDM
jgi:hypothetical protein